MMGRYGNDQLNLAVLTLSLVFSLVSFFTGGIVSLVFWFFQVLFIAYWAMRAFSRNIYKRQKENYVFMTFLNKIKKRFSGVTAFFKRLADRKHKYFKCPRCASRLRVPRGRGNITVTCPRCRHQFDKKS